MKKIIITCAVLCFGTAVSFAQDAATPATQAQPVMPMRANQSPLTPEQHAQRLAKRDEAMFQLNPDQSKKVYDVEFEFVSAMEKFRSENKQPNQAEREAIMNKKDAKMKEILTADQYTKYDMSRNRQRNPAMAPATQQQAK